ncbi:hypothetical protein ACHAW5_004823 [Stephanodiscus triporus]|uniref:SPX domain-containing protein n=1 Tax=Stephanodiscus triporus TaxID=2934178 RepID=A0ABD3N403_9STRA
MVEFGLKLEDNKVDEWSSQYIDYEKLKAELKYAKASATHRDDVLKRMPRAVAEEMAREMKDREAGYSSGLETRSRCETPVASVDGSYEITPLLGGQLKRTNSWSNLSSNLNHTVFKVTSYLGLADDRELFRKACDDADDKLGIFVRTYEQEVKKVQDFYNEKTDEISQRLEVLVESVDTSGLQPKEKYEKRKSLVQTLTYRFEEMLQGKGNLRDNSIRVSKIPDLGDIFSGESMDDEDGLNNKKKRDEMMRKSDSIKRAITDVYRTSKLLHNYSIMNYTGFVKIAKKFDKTIPAHKGKLKGKICDDGKQAELLAFKLFNDAVDETLVFLVTMLMYYKADSGDMPLLIPPRAYPFFLIMYTIKCLIFPWKMRKPLWIAIKQVISAPFVSPTFFLTYVGDVFTSMVKVFQDLLWSFCFVASGDFLLRESDPGKYDHSWSQKFWYKNVAIPLICLLPLWFRFNQCLRRYLDTGKRMPNLANAFKYAMSQSVTLFGAFHPLYLMYVGDGVRDISLADDDDNLDGRGQSNFFVRHVFSFQLFWMGLFIASSLYSFCWDVYMDWGLGRREHGFLGTRLMFPKRSYYYTVIGLDLVLRFMWVLTLIPVSEFYLCRWILTYLTTIYSCDSNPT